MSKLMAWNIRQGGGNRVDAIMHIVAMHQSDVLLLTEYRENQNASSIKNSLEMMGFRFFAASGSHPKLNAVLLASKYPFELISLSGGLVEHSNRLIVAQFESYRLMGVYFPQGRKKEEVFQYLMHYLPEHANSDCMVMGDFNTGRNRDDTEGAKFCCAEYMDVLGKIGFLDAWRQRNPNRSEFSWYSNTGNGFRIDHALCTQKALDCVEDIYYSHCERISGTSDHSSLLVQRN